MKVNEQHIIQQHFRKVTIAVIVHLEHFAEIFVYFMYDLYMEFSFGQQRVVI